VATTQTKQEMNLMIKLNDITKQYKAGNKNVTALRIDTHIAKGEFLVITGRSGSGKSTLLNILAGIDCPTTGDVQVLGSSITGLDESQMAQWRGNTMGIVFQFFQLIPNLSVMENILLPMDLVQKKKYKKNRTEAMVLLEKVGMQNHAGKMPAELSGGEQQRVAIARALANNAPILIADEPTGNLDSENARSIIELFGALAREGKTIIMVTHEREHIQGSTRQIVLKDGIIVEDIQFAEEVERNGLAG